MTTTTMRQLLLAGCALLFLSIALASVPAPHFIAGQYGLTLPSVDAFNEFRAVFLGFWLGLALLYGTAARRPELPILGDLGGAMIVLQSLARCLSLVIDGVPGPLFLFATVSELAIGGAILALRPRRSDVAKVA